MEILASHSRVPAQSQFCTTMMKWFGALMIIATLSWTVLAWSGALEAQSERTRIERQAGELVPTKCPACQTALPRAPAGWAATTAFEAACLIGGIGIDIRLRHQSDKLLR